MKHLQKGDWKSDEDNNISNDDDNNEKEVKLVFGTKQHFCICSELKPSICQQHF